MGALSREELEAEVLRLRSRHPETEGEAFGRKLQSTPAGREQLLSAVEKTRMPMILTDPSLPDDPIVFANRAFQDLSGYGAEDLVGHNCRFLQGPETDPAHVQAIRDALAAKRDIAIDILNYRLLVDHPRGDRLGQDLDALLRRHEEPSRPPGP